MVKICVREDSVNPATDRAKLCYGRFLDTDSATKTQVSRKVHTMLIQRQFVQLASSESIGVSTNTTIQQEAIVKEIPAGKILVTVK